MKNPVYPGLIVRHDCLEPLGLTVTAGAKILGVTRQALSNVVNGKSGISPEMAIRLTKAFGSTPETWLRMQLAYDLAAARKNERNIKVRRQPVPRESRAARTGAAAERLVKDAALRLLSEDARFRAAVREGIAQADRGEFIEEDDMDARLEQMLRS